MTKPTIQVWGETASITPLSSAQQSQGYAYTASKPGQLAGTVETDDLDFPMKQATTAISWVLDYLTDDGWYSIGNGAIAFDNNGTLWTTKDKASASSTVGGSGWSVPGVKSALFGQSGYEELENGRILQWGPLTANSVVNFAIPFPNEVRALSFAQAGSAPGTLEVLMQSYTNLTQTGFQLNTTKYTTAGGLVSNNHGGTYFAIGS